MRGEPAPAPSGHAGLETSLGVWTKALWGVSELPEPLTFHPGDSRHLGIGSGFSTPRQETGCRGREGCTDPRRSRWGGLTPQSLGKGVLWGDSLCCLVDETLMGCDTVRHESPKPLSWKLH